MTNSSDREGILLRGFSCLSTFLHDVLYALRSLKRYPGYTGVTILSLALGIGANTAVFGWLDTWLLRRLPVPQPNTLYQIVEVHPDRTYLGFDHSTFELFRNQNRVSEGIAGYCIWDANIEGETAAVQTQIVSGTYFPVLGIKPAAGRLLDQADEASGQGAVAVLSHNYWKRKFALNTGAVGSSLYINGTAIAVVGVALPAFAGVDLDTPADIFMPMSAISLLERRAELNSRWRGKSVEMVCRLKPGVTRDLASANLQSIFLGILEQQGSLRNQSPDRMPKISLRPAGRGAFSRLREKMERPLLFVTAAVTLVLLIACANVINMMLVRIVDRDKEMAVRLALGSSRARLIRLTLIESFLLSAAGGALGLFFLGWSNNLLQLLMPAGRLNLDVNWHVWIFAMIVSLLISVICGLLPGIRATHVEVIGTINKAPGYWSTGRSRIGDYLIVGQVVLSLTLLLPAILCLRSLQNLAKVDIGFDKDRVLLLHINPLSAGYEDSRLVRLYEDLQQHLQQVPGVKSASFSLTGVFQAGVPAEIGVPGYAPSLQEDSRVYSEVISPGYFETVGIPILLGRDFARESPNGKKVALINKAMSSFYFPGQDPLGKRISLRKFWRNPEEVEIIGVAGDGKYGNLRRGTDRMIYVSHFQAPDWSIRPYTIELGITGNERDVTASIWREIHALDAAIPVTNVTRLSQFVSDSIAPERLVARVVAGFSCIALLLTCLGIYGTMSYLVARRTREIGIRMAMGARAPNLIWMVERKTLLLICIGILIGIPCEFSFARVLAHLLFGISEADPFSAFVSLVAITLAGAFAACLPAIKASHVDVITVLRSE